MDWIDIKTKTPDDNQRVLCFTLNKPDDGEFYICCGHYFPDKHVPSKFQLDSDDVDDMLKDDHEITHWMELPSSPR